MLVYTCDSAIFEFRFFHHACVVLGRVERYVLQMSSGVKRCCLIFSVTSLVYVPLCPLSNNNSKTTNNV